MHFTCRSFLGRPSSINWSQYWENEPDDPVVVSKLGHLFGLINLQLGDEPEIPISNLGRQIIDRLSQQYFSATLDPLANLKETIRQLLDSPSFSQYADRLSLSLVVVLHQQIFLATYSDNHIFFQRGDKVSRLISGKLGHTASLAGTLQSEDKIFLASDEFLKHFPWDDFKHTLSEPKIQTIEENILSQLNTIENQNGIAAAYIQTHIETSPESSTDLFNPPTPPENQPSETATPLPSNSHFPKKSIFKKLYRPKPTFVSYQQINQVNRRKKVNILVAVILLIALAASSYLGFKKNQSDKTQAQYQQLKESLEKKLSDAQAIKNLNLDSALVLASEAKDISKQMQQLNINLQEIESFQQSIESLLSQTGSPDSFTPQLFYDTSLIMDNPQFTKLSISATQLYLLDSQNGRIDSVNIQQKSTQVISKNDEIKQGIGIFEIDGNIYMFTAQGVFLSEKQSVDQKIDFSQLDQTIEPLDVQSWNGAVYLLDKNQSTIIKFNPNSTGFGSPQTWLKQPSSLNSPSSMAINGRIWVVSSDGSITPFTRGVSDPFEQSASSISRADNLVTTPDTDIISFTDSAQNIFVFKKDGETLAKYNLGQLQINDIAISQDGQFIYVLCSDQKIYRISL